MVKKVKGLVGLLILSLLITSCGEKNSDDSQRVLSLRETLKESDRIMENPSTGAGLTTSFSADHMYVKVDGKILELSYKVDEAKNRLVIGNQLVFEVRLTDEGPVLEGKGENRIEKLLLVERKEK